ncbi:MAG: hypothetical protein HC831_31720 [Chloroflexia bacterium]|nr:hypothetical protein [Chloroflexia bacterium]
MNKILSFLGIGKEAETSLTEEQKATLNAAEAKLTELETANDAALTEKDAQLKEAASAKEAAEAAVTAATQAKEAIEAEKTSLEAALQAAQEKITLLEKKPDAESAAAGNTGDQNGGDSGEPRKLNSWEEKAIRKTSKK